MDVDHELIMVACLFLASKVEEKNFARLDDDDHGHGGRVKQIDGDFLIKNFLPKHELEQVGAYCLYLYVKCL